MKRFAGLFLILAVFLPVSAVENGQALYVGGTVPALKADALGRMDTTSPTVLTFEYPGGALEIPYAKIESFAYSQQVARHLGVLPAIAVGLLKQRQHRHFIRISYRDERNASQVAIFEVPKQIPHTLLAILHERTKQAYSAEPQGKCGGNN
ncbi:MAG TPA: hypothetical protein VJO53_03355 [Candidatus Acidoferrales bacterium]|nr:hypothetical protein [Candidatus Acidoferrales bacterium]